MKILLAEDERKVRDFIRTGLEQAGMVVDTATSLSELRSFIEANAYEVLILDRLLHGGDSLPLIAECRRRQPEMKIIILSALSDVDERVRGLSEGADDYLEKPFHVTELLARVRALLRRHLSGSSGKKDTQLVYKDLAIDLEKQRVHRGGEKVDLTKKEFQILALLARHPGNVFSKTTILDQVWDMNHHPESNVIEVTIANLRAKIDRGRKSLIQSQRGIGYWLGDR